RFSLKGCFEALEHAGGLDGVTGGPDAEVDVGRRQAELPEEDVGHQVVVVLAGVDEDLIMPAAQGAAEQGRLDALGPAANDGDGWLAGRRSPTGAAWPSRWSPGSCRRRSFGRSRALRMTTRTDPVIASRGSRWIGVLVLRRGPGGRERAGGRGGCRRGDGGRFR